MGIRVHKIIGYGLNNIQHKEGEINDPRFNSKLLQDVLDNDVSTEDEFTLDKFKSWLKVNRTKMAGILRTNGFDHMDVKRHALKEEIFCSSFHKTRLNNSFPDLYELVITDIEFGIPNVMVFCTWTSVCNWKRYDDTIDWTEETVSYGQKARYLPLDQLTGIYPHNGDVVRTKSPVEKVASKLVQSKNLFPPSEVKLDKDGLPHQMNGGWYNMLVGRWSVTQEPKVKDDVLLHFIGDWRPRLPMEIIWLLYYLEDRGCILDVTAIKRDLFPMLYVYWS